MSDIEPSALANLRRIGGRHLAGRIVDLFLTGTPRRIEILRASGARGDLERLRRTAHSLRSSAGNVGALRVGEVAGRIEQLVARKPDGVPSLVDDLEREFARVRPHLEAALERGRE